MDMKKWLYSYRLGQVCQQLGFVAPLAAREYGEVSQWLPAAALALFKTMSPADQRHSLRVCRGLQAHGCRDRDMLAAALLHDVGKAGGRVPFWTRPVIVLGKKLAPGLLKRLVVYPGVQRTKSLPGWPFKYRFLGTPPSVANGERKSGGTPETPPGAAPLDLAFKKPMLVSPGWRRALSYAWYHAEVGAELAAAAGLSQRAVLYIRTHHQADGPAAELHKIDEVS